jgi:hypothetical protein
MRAAVTTTSPPTGLETAAGRIKQLLMLSLLVHGIRGVASLQFWSCSWLVSILRVAKCMGRLQHGLLSGVLASESKLVITFTLTCKTDSMYVLVSMIAAQFRASCNTLPRR